MQSFVSQKKEGWNRKGTGFLETISNWKMVSSKAMGGGGGRNLTKIEEELGGGGGLRVPPLR